MAVSFYILNGPMAGYDIPYTNAPFIREFDNSGVLIDYEPAPADCCQKLGPCVMLLGTKVTKLPNGVMILAHPKWIRTLLKPRQGSIMEVETDAPGMGIDMAGQS